MKKIITLVAIALFSINARAQETKLVAKEVDKTEDIAHCKMKDAKKC